MIALVRTSRMQMKRLCETFKFELISHFQSHHTPGDFYFFILIKIYNEGTQYTSNYVVKVAVIRKTKKIFSK